MMCKYFFLFCWLSFHFFDGILRNTKVINFDGFIYLLFCFVTWALGVTAKTPLLNQRSWRFTPKISSKKFTISALTFWPLMHSEIIFICGVKLTVQLHYFTYRYLHLKIIADTVYPVVHFSWENFYVLDMYGVCVCKEYC